LLIVKGCAYAREGMRENRARKIAKLERTLIINNNKGVFRLFNLNYKNFPLPEKKKAVRIQIIINKPYPSIPGVKTQYIHGYQHLIMMYRHPLCL
jgi:hypothetical protein